VKNPPAAGSFVAVERVAAHILPLAFAVLFGISDAAQTVRNDFPTHAVFWARSQEEGNFILRASPRPSVPATCDGRGEEV